MYETIRTGDNPTTGWHWCIERCTVVTVRNLTEEVGDRPNQNVNENYIVNCAERLTYINEPCMLVRMDRARIISMRESGASIKEIMEDQGVSRSSIYNVLTQAGVTRPKVDRPSMIDFEPPPRHRRQAGYRMMLAITAEAQGLSIGDTSREKLAMFKRQLDKRVWTYNTQRGFHWVPREERHGTEIFVKNA